MAEELRSGPDQIRPAEDYITTDPAGCVRLRIPQSGKSMETLPPVSIPGYLKKTVELFPNRTALGRKVNGKWERISYSEYEKMIRTCAKAFIKLGLEERHSVCIIGFNSVEWFVSDLATICAGGIVAGIYTTNSAEACYHCCETARANIVVVEDEQQLEKIISIRDRLPKLRAIVQYTGEPPKYDDVYNWDQLIELGQNVPDNVLEERLKRICINECCTLVFTSGTVGAPKAVMLNHDNLIWDAIAIAERIRLNREKEESIVSYLPLSHVAAQVVDIYLVMYFGGAVYFADKLALKGSLVNTLREVRPTKFLGVPRVYEKIYEKMQEVAAQNGCIKKIVASWAKEKTLQHHLDLFNGIPSKSWEYSVASSIIFKKVKEALGLERCTFFCSAAAPLAADVKKYFLSIDMPVMECYGMSEASGAHTIAIETATNLETIGMTIPGMKTKIVNPEDGQGEVCMQGRHIFMGYLGELEKTKETIDEEGWLHTGDLGKVDEKGFLYITGRLKELIITAGGENVPPVLIEQLVKQELPSVSNAFLVGDKRKFLSVLLTLKTEVDGTTSAPLDTLLPPVQEWLKKIGCSATTVTEVLQDGPNQKLIDAINEGIERANQHAISNAQKIRKFALLPVDFSLATGEVGPTMKLKRRVVEEKYKDVIENMYQN